MVIGDLGDPSIVDHAVKGAATVFHVGAAMRGGPRDFEAGTVWGTRNVVDACLRHASGRLVYVSSMSVLDHAGREPGQVLTENYVFEPHPEWRGAYTQTKLAAEKMVSDAIRDHGLPATILRPGQIFGPGAERVTPNGVLALAGRWVAVGPGVQTLPLVYADDVVDALLLAAEEPGAVGRLFNIVDTTPVTQQATWRAASPAWAAACACCACLAGCSWCSGGVEHWVRLLKREVPLTPLPRAFACAACEPSIPRAARNVLGLASRGRGGPPAWTPPSAATEPQRCDPPGPQ